MKTTVVGFCVCSCGVVGPLARDTGGTYRCPTGVLTFSHTELDQWREGFDVPPSPFWSCGARGHFSLVALWPDGTFRSIRDVETLKAFITSGMLRLVRKAQDGGFEGLVRGIFAKHPELAAPEQRR